MKLQGILDFSLGNFLCLRGFAPMGVLHDISKPDASFQRDLLQDHKAEMVAFLDEGEFLFFPEVILCATLGEDEFRTEVADSLREAVRQGKNTRSGFADFRLTSSVKRTTSREDARAIEFFTSSQLEVLEGAAKFWRIDGNHRLSATPESEKFRAYIAPFCLILFRTPDEAKRFSRALFHNINYKQEPLTMEQNLKLILDDEESLFSDDDLKDKPAFGWPYYLARKTHKNLDFDLLPNIRPFLEEQPRTFYVEQFGTLIKEKVLNESEQAKTRFKQALGEVNGLFTSHPTLTASKNRGLLAALLWYQLTNPSTLTSFVRWVLENHLQHIEQSNGSDLIQIFDRVLATHRRTIFVSMPFGKPETENHFGVIERVCREISNDKKLNPPLKVDRVDWFHDGTSYNLIDKIIEMMSDCGLLIANLTFCNPNVYHEIGFVMGKAKAEGAATANMLLFLDESYQVRSWGAGME